MTEQDAREALRERLAEALPARWMDNQGRDRIVSDPATVLDALLPVVEEYAAERARAMKWVDDFRGQVVEALTERAEAAEAKVARVAWQAWEDGWAVGHHHEPAVNPWFRAEGEGGDADSGRSVVPVSDERPFAVPEVHSDNERAAE